MVAVLLVTIMASSKWQDLIEQQTEAGKNGTIGRD